MCSSPVLPVSFPLLVLLCILSPYWASAVSKSHAVSREPFQSITECVAGLGESPPQITCYRRKLHTHPKDRKIWVMGTARTRSARGEAILRVWDKRPGDKAHSGRIYRHAITVL